MKPKTKTKTPKPSAMGAKVFCIGFNKTGTVSLHRFLRAQGMKSVHNVQWPLATLRRHGRKALLDANCYSDGEGAEFERLVEWFPSALVVLNVREERAWLRSRVKHVFRKELEEAADPPTGLMARQFRAAPELALDAWIATRRLYHARARRFFDGDARYLEISVTDQPDWAARLAGHLSAHSLPVKTAEPPEHANKRDTAEFARFPEIHRYLDLVDQRLARFGPDEAPRSDLPQVAMAQ